MVHIAFKRIKFCLERLYQVDFELGKINIERLTEAKRSIKQQDDLRDEAFEICVRWPLDVQVAPANVVKSFIVIMNRDVCVLQQAF